MSESPQVVIEDEHLEGCSDINNRVSAEVVEEPRHVDGIAFPLNKKDQILAELGFNEKSVIMFPVNQPNTYFLTKKESTKQDYIEARMRCVSDHRESLHEEKENLESEKQSAESQLTEIINEMQATQERLELISDSDLEEKKREKFLNEFEMILGFDRVEAVNVENEKLKVFTDWIDIEHEGETYRIGKFVIVISIELGGEFLKCKNLSNNKVSGYHHPHVNSGGYVCLGNVARSLSKHIGENQFQIAIDLIIQFLEKYNPGNPYQPVEYWDTVEEFEEKETNEKREFEKESSKEKFLAACWKRSQNFKGELLEEREDLCDEAEEKQRLLAKKTREIQQIRDELDLIEAPGYKDKKREKFSDEFEMILGFDKVEAIDVKDGGLKVFTDWIDIEHEGETYRIGKFVVSMSIELDDIFLRCGNLSQTGDSCQHPHVTRDGSVCFDSSFDSISKYIGRNKFHVAIDLMIQNLEKYKEDSCCLWIENWPTLDEFKVYYSETEEIKRMVLEKEVDPVTALNREKNISEKSLFEAREQLMRWLKEAIGWKDRLNSFISYLSDFNQKEEQP